VLQDFDFGPVGRELQRVALGVTEDKEAVRLEQLTQLRVVQQLLREGLGTAADIFLTVRRIGEDEVEADSGDRELADGGEDILDAHLKRAAGKAGGLVICADDTGVAIRLLNANDMRRAAAEAIETQRAGAGEEFEDVRINDAFAKAVEDSLFD
jgi:hypothetical protein